MARLQWALTCRDISVDNSTNNVTYRDAIEQVRLGEFPVELPPLFLISMLWRRDEIETPEHFEYRIVVENEAEEEIGRTPPSEVDLTEYERVRATVNTPVIHIENPGTIWYRIQKNEGNEWEDAGELPIEAKELQETTSGPAATAKLQESKENNGSEDS